MNFGLDDIINKTVFGTPKEDLSVLTETLQKALEKTTSVPGEKHRITKRELVCPKNKENKLTTYKEDFFDKLPEAATTANGYPCFTCACMLYPEIKDRHEGDCEDCKACWDMEFQMHK